jgi:hypothetical protein
MAIMLIAKNIVKLRKNVNAVKLVIVHKNGIIPTKLATRIVTNTYE